MEGVISRVHSSGWGLLGTWVKIPALETIQLLGHAGFDFVVIDMEHAPHTLAGAVELVFAAQAMGMSALVRLPDHTGMTIQPLLDGGADVSKYIGRDSPSIPRPAATKKAGNRIVARL